MIGLFWITKNLGIQCSSAPLFNAFTGIFDQNQKRGFGFQAAVFAATTQFVVVEKWDMTELPRKTNLTPIKGPIEDHAQAHSPAHVDDQGIFFLYGSTETQLGQGDEAGIIVDENGYAQGLLKVCNNVILSL